MEYLMERLNDNFTVDVVGWGNNPLGQPFIRLMICNNAYSIVDNTDGTFELAIADGEGGMDCMSPLSADEVIEEVAQASADYMAKLCSNHLALKHGIGIW